MVSVFVAPLNTGLKPGENDSDSRFGSIARSLKLDRFSESELCGPKQAGIITAFSALNLYPSRK